MKEAAGEANLTVITIILIAVIAAIATPLITTLLRNTAKRSCCTNAGGQWQANQTCLDASGQDIMSTIWNSSDNTCNG